MPRAMKMKRVRITVQYDEVNFEVRAVARRGLMFDAGLHGPADRLAARNNLAVRHCKLQDEVNLKRSCWRTNEAADAVQILRVGHRVEQRKDLLPRLAPVMHG